jgi:hypothetical protein
VLPCPTRCSRVDSLSPVFAAQIMSQLREMDTVEEQWTELYSSKRVTKASKFSGGSALCQVRHRSSAMNKLRIVERNRRASRNGRVSYLPPEIP